MRNKFVLFLIILLHAFLASAKIPYEYLKHADENRLNLTEQAYSQGEYMKCIAYADSIHSDIEGYLIKDSETICRTNALVHAYAAAACNQLSQHGQIEDLSHKSFYVTNSSYYFLREGAKHYLNCSFYFNRFLLKKRITTATDSNDFIRLYLEIDLACIANYVAKEFWKEAAFNDKSNKKTLREAEKEGKQYDDFFFKQILPNKHLAKDNISIYYGLYTSEVILSFEDKEARKNCNNIIHTYLKELSDITLLASPNQNKIIYVSLRNNLKRMCQIICQLANERGIIWEPAVELYINYLNFCEFTKGIQEQFKLTTYNEIKSTLGLGEYLLVFYEAPVMSGTLYHASQHNMKHSYAFVLGWDMDEVKILQRKLNQTITEENLSQWQSWWPGMKSLYVLPTEYIKTKDYAGVNQNVHMIMSVNSLLEKKNRMNMSYKVKILANLTYSKYDDTDVEEIDTPTKGIGFYPLPYTQKEVAFLQDKLSDSNLEIIEGEKGTRSALLRKGEENVLHISTHGDMDQSLLDRLNQLEPEDGYTGDNALRSCYLILSMYNDAEHPVSFYNRMHRTYDETCVSGYDIKEHYLDHLDLVFLDACKTAYAKNVNGDTFSLVEAFKIAGVKNIIAYLEPVRDDVAAEFSELFYTKLLNGLNIHDSFYEAKKEIYKEYPDLKIVLWE